MKKEGFFLLALIVCWIWMVIRAFFWWSWWWENISSNSTGFVEELTNTWDSSWNISTNESLNSPQDAPSTSKTHTEIRVMMPSYFYNAGWKNFAEDLYKNQKVFMNFKFINDLNDYRDTISNPNFSWADIMLFPYDWYQNVSTRSFSFQQRLESAFDPLVKFVVSWDKISFLPFAVDPMIMYVNSEQQVKNTFSEISNFVWDRSSQKPNSFPLFFWITSEDYDSQWFQREYQDIVRYALMNYFTTYRDSNSLWKWIDSNVFEHYNAAQQKSTLQLISACRENPSFPSICLQIYNLVWIRFWFLSDADIVQKYYKWKKTDFDKISKSKMPFSDIQSPVRLRWRSMPASLQDATTVNAVYLFLSQYMNKHDSYQLRGSTLSVFAPFTNISLEDNEFIWYRWYILQTWWDYINTLRWISKFWDLIEYKITAKKYLR